ncbi:MAG: acyl-ACP--UDP-N-acetylglucosamine O-acyltransferase [Pseudomonadota bacterium]|nr:acyl-ACP--UDP-N-acetylglucosamine O-acyltransferase [Pseudomonadota bacterium]
MGISKQAQIHETAVIDESVTIGPWSVIGPNVKIGKGTKISSHVVIKENTTIGKNNTFHQFASIGSDPQVRDYKDQDSFLEIGDNNVFHESVTISRGDLSGSSITKIGNNNLFMTCSHVAHDCVIGNNVILVNYSAIGGHVVVEDFVTIGVYCSVHQFCTLGKHSFLARGGIVTKDVLPFTMVDCRENKAIGINKVGLTRRGFSKGQIKSIFQCYKIIARTDLLIKDAIIEMGNKVNDKDIVNDFAKMLKNSERGVVK